MYGDVRIASPSSDRLELSASEQHWDYLDTWSRIKLLLPNTPLSLAAGAFQIVSLSPSMSQCTNPPSLSPQSPYDRTAN